MKMRASTLGRRFWKLTQLIDNPTAARLQLQGVSPETYLTLSQPWFVNQGIDTVFDVGANRGQFAIAIATAMPLARIISMEPLPSAYRLLVKAVAPYKRIRAINCGVGAAEGVGVIHENRYSDSSSFRPMKQLHREQFPFTQGNDIPVQVSIRTLDGIAREVDFGSRILVKIDVQGFEDEVIRGAVDTLGRADLVIVEVSFISLYEGSPSFDEVNDMLRGQGLHFAGCIGQLIGPLDGSILQGDALFVRGRARVRS
jgi:FkbM family methyltransferase